MRDKDQFTRQDPTQQYPRPGEPLQRIDYPGSTAAMPDQPDHGEATYRGSRRLEGRRAIITGGDSGIGRAVAIAFAREGADVLISYLPEEEEDARETRRLVTGAGRSCVTTPGDIRDRGHCLAIVDQAVTALGGIDVLVCNAAYQQAQAGGIADITEEQLDRVMRTNIYAMVWLCQMAIPHMAPGSSIITTSSIQAYQPSPELLDYAMTKAAIVNFTRGLAQAVASRGIRVNTIAPGPIWTPLIPATAAGDQVSGFGANTPLGRAGQPAELAPVYVFLASQESSYVTGERIGVTGGMTTP